MMQALTQIGLTHYLGVGALLFATGITVVLIRRSAVAMLLGVELVANAAALNFVAFNHYLAAQRQVILAEGAPSRVLLFEGQMFTIFIITIAAAEAAVALALLLNLYNMLNTAEMDDVKALAG